MNFTFDLLPLLREVGPRAGRELVPSDGRQLAVHEDLPRRRARSGAAVCTVAGGDTVISTENDISDNKNINIIVNS